MLGEDVPASIAPAEAVVPVTPTAAEEDQLGIQDVNLRDVKLFWTSTIRICALFVHYYKYYVVGFSKLEL